MNDEQLIWEAYNDINESKGSSDIEYIQAFENQDTQKAQAIVHERAKSMGYTIGPVFHGTKSNFRRFSKKVFPNFNTSQTILGFFFSINEEYAKQYGNKIISVYLKGRIKEEPETLIDEIENNWSNQKTGLYVSKLKKAGYDGVQFGDLEISVFNPNQIKLANPFTFKPNGDIIPLSKRFNDKSYDIHY